MPIAKNRRKIRHNSHLETIASNTEKQRIYTIGRARFTGLGSSGGQVSLPNAQPATAYSRKK